MIDPGSDTPPHVERMMIELWRRATPAQKLEKMARMARELNELTRAEIRGRYPEATPREVELRLASRTIDRDTMIQAFGWDSALHGR
jgi:HEPN domain-containing protein